MSLATAPGWAEGDPLSPTYLNSKFSSNMSNLSGPVVIGNDPGSSSTALLRVGSHVVFANDILIKDAGGETRGITIDRYSNITAGELGATVRGRLASGTSSNPGSTQSLQAVAFSLHGTDDGTTFTGRAEIVLGATEDHTASAHGTNIAFRTTQTGATTLQSRWLINGVGDVVPNLDNTYDIGQPTSRVSLVYVAKVIANNLFAYTQVDVTPLDGSAAYFATSYGDQPVYIGARASGTSVAPTSVVTGNVLAALVGRGYATATSAFSSAAAVAIRAAEQFTTNRLGGEIAFQTASVGSTVVNNRWFVRDDGTLKSNASSAFAPRIDPSLTSSGMTIGEMAFALSGNTLVMYVRSGGTLYTFDASAATVG